MIYEGTTSHDRRVMIDTDDCSLLVEVLFAGTWIEQINCRFANLRILSEHLSDSLMYGHAVDLLTRWQIDHTSPLWTLNHKGGFNHFTDK